MWVTEPQWPLSRHRGEPMRFIGQIQLDRAVFPQTTAQMAYVFMTGRDDERHVNEATHDPEGGENSVILQPGATEIPTAKLTEGPLLFRRSRDRLQTPCEYAVSLIEEDDVEFVSEKVRHKMRRDGLPPPRDGMLDENKVGGTPVFLQGDEFPFDGNCQLLLQLSSEVVPFHVEFGDAGIGYAFLNEAGDKAQFLCQSC